MTAPSPAAAGLPAEDVERVARAIWEAASDHPDRPVWPEVGSALRDYYRDLAAAALAEMRPSPDSEADADEAMHRIADRYRDKDAARFAIGDYRDWLRERRPSPDSEAHGPCPTRRGRR